jgi:hypothetical protein
MELPSGAAPAAPVDAEQVLASVGSGWPGPSGKLLEGLL